MNTDSRTVNSIRNIGSGFIGQLIQTAAGFANRTIFVYYLSVEYLGLNGLFASILSMLALAELGLGSAFTYSLYKPLAEGEKQTIAGILGLYRKAYHTIGITIFIIGLALMPFLNAIIGPKPEAITENIYILYLFFLFNTAATYFFSYKIALLNADQRNYISTFNYSVFFVLQNVVQIIVLIWTRNFLYYLCAQAVFQLASNFSISIITDKYYPFLKTFRKEKIDPFIRKGIIKNAKATFLIKIGGVLVNNTDNLIINYFSGLVLVGLASNYNLLIGIATAMIVQIFNNVSSSIAQVNVRETKAKQYEVFSLINFANFWIYGWGAIAISLLMGDFIQLWIGEKFVLPFSIAVMLAVNFFMVGMQSAVWTFKSTYGFFNEGKYLVILTAILNLLFSFVLGSVYGLFGILLATALARVSTNFWYDPFVVFKKGLQKPPSTYALKLAMYVVVLLITFVTTYFALQWNMTLTWWVFIAKAFLCLLIPNLIFVVFFFKREEFKILARTTTGSLQMLKRMVTKSGSV